MASNVIVAQSGGPSPVINNSLQGVIPKEWLSKSKIDVTDDFIRYAKPLIGTKWIKIPLKKGIQRFTRFQPVFAEKKCPAYAPEAYNK